MKLFLNKNQRNLLLEILRASENNAIGGNDPELAAAFSSLYKTIEPTNAAYISLKRGDAETIIEFSEAVKLSLDKTVKFLNDDTERESEEKQDLIDQAISAKTEIEAIIKQLEEKIAQNPV